MLRQQLHFLLCLLALLFLSVGAQTVTTTDGSGATIVQVIGTNGVGSTTTQIIQTLSPSSSSSSSSASPTTSENTQVGQLGPVNGQPPTTTGIPGAPTPYAYTTVVNGVTTVIQDTFTPSSPKTTPLTAPANGTILAYSEWLSIYGTPTSLSHNAGITLRPSIALAILTISLPCWIGLLG